ncbi:MAG: phage minor capsid protein [Oscillospiraceae bacterium]|nr:phage minor capsid protein [Oscillospiraceae bacterium]
MLNPEFLASLPEAILKLFYAAERQILVDMARKIVKYDYYVPSAEYQRQKLREAGVMQDEILTALAKLTRRSEEELRQMMQEACGTSLRGDTAIYEAAGHTVPSIGDNGILRQILNAGYKATAQTMRNLCKTTARTAAQQFENALDGAWLKVYSGAFDSETAIRSAIKDLTQKGIQAIRYPSGRTDSLETAVRRAVVTGVNQTSAQLQEELADELDCDLVEVSAHAGARPEHAVWQGRIFSRSGTHPKYPDFRAATGYGRVDGLCGANCRHTFGPYIEGSPPVWSEEELKKLDDPKYEYNGQKLTEYEASQIQRNNERQIRRWQREYAAMEAAGLDTSEAAAKLKYWEETQDDFLDKTGLPRQYEREQISVAKSQKSGIMGSGSGSVYIKSIDSPIEQRHTGKGNPNAVLHFDVSLNNRQQKLLDALPNYNSRIIVKKSEVNLADLATLTAKTGDEFALFTKAGDRLIVRGNSAMVEITPQEAYDLGRQGYTWSGHTHPGVDFNCLQPSDGDYAILNCFNQDSSAIYNSSGSFILFERTEPYV